MNINTIMIVKAAVWLICPCQAAIIAMVPMEKRMIVRVRSLKGVPKTMVTFAFN